MLQRANLRRPGVPVEVALDLDKGRLGFADRSPFARVQDPDEGAACTKRLFRFCTVP